MAWKRRLSFSIWFFEIRGANLVKFSSTLFPDCAEDGGSTLVGKTEGLLLGLEI